jgi:gluconolactonase
MKWNIKMQLKTICLALSLLVSVVGCAEKPSLPAMQMQKLSGFKTPESLIQAKDGNIYVSEINGFGQDGDGKISVIKNGKTTVFATGLDDPKGLAIIGDFLYVADKTQILKIALSDASKKSVFVSASTFPKMPLFLNDLEADPHGNLYVSDSGDILGSGKGGVIYKINPQGQVQKLIDGAQNDKVMAPNGLLVDAAGKQLIWVDFTSGILYSLNTVNGQLTQIAEGFGGGDGIAHHSNGTMYVSDWKSGKVFSVTTQGEVALIKEGYQSAADIALTNDQAYLMVPDMKAGLLDFIPLTK